MRQAGPKLAAFDIWRLREFGRPTRHVASGTVRYPNPMSLEFKAPVQEFDPLGGVRELAELEQLLLEMAAEVLGLAIEERARWGLAPR